MTKQRLRSREPRVASVVAPAGTAVTPDPLGWMHTTDEALKRWGLQDARVKPLSLSENATYLVTPADGSPASILRLHRPNYRSVACVRSEMAWLKAIREDGRVITAGILPALDGKEYCTYTNQWGQMQIADMMECLTGVEPLEEGLDNTAERIGGVAAVLHGVSQTWEQPEWFERITWDEARMLGDAGDYGDWRDTPEVTPAMREVFEAAESKALAELDEMGKTHDNFGLIHTDLRSSNLLIDEDGTVKVFDFDDCGFGWYLFDVATTFTFEETKPGMEQKVRAYVKGYRAAGGVIPDADFAHLPGMLMARRLNMVAWVERRRETEWAQQIRGWFVDQTQDMALDYLAGRYLGSVVADAKAGRLS